MSRKRLNSYILIGLCICFLVCLLGSYNLAREYVAKDFENTIDNLIVDFEKKYGMENNFGHGDSYFETSPEALMGEFSKEADHTYPWQAVFTDSEKNIVARSGSWMYFYDKGSHENINFDLYLTEEHWVILDKFWENVDYPVYIDNPLTREYVGYGLDYNVINGEIIPVKLVLVELERPDHIATIVFSEEKAKYHCSGNMLDYKVDEDILATHRNSIYYFPIADESIPNKSSAYMRVHFTDVETGGRNREIYDELSECLSEENMRKDYALKLSHDQKYYEKNQYLHEGYLQINGKYYTMYLLAEYSEFDEVIRSEVFLNAIKIQGILILLFGTMLFVIVNHLYKKNLNLEASRQMFTSAVAHELKTPIAIIQNQCECILEDIAPEKNKEYIKSVYDEATVMNKMVMSFLQYNRLQMTDKIEKERCNLYEIVSQELQKYEDLIESADLVLETELAEEIYTNANRELIGVVIGNYISNAYKYTEEGRKVKISLRKDNDKVCFEVFNEGAFIEDKYEKEIWDVLSRQDKARNRKIGSSGMGLPICRKILELHGAEYGYENTDDGVRFYFRM